MTFKVEGWLDGKLIAEECGVEADCVYAMVDNLADEGFEIFIKREEY